jgi:hypothetical protein
MARQFAIGSTYNGDLLRLATSNRSADLRAAITAGVSWTDLAYALVAAANAAQIANVDLLLNYFDLRSHVWPLLQVFAKTYANHIDRKADTVWNTISEALYGRAEVRYGSRPPRAIQVQCADDTNGDKLANLSADRKFQL